MIQTSLFLQFKYTTNFLFSSEILTNIFIRKSTLGVQLFYLVYDIYKYILLMAQNQDKYEPDEQIPKQSDNSQYDINYQAIDPQSDLDLQQQYVNKLKTQRKRIQELSQLHTINQEKIDKEVDKNKQLQEQIIKLSAMKDYQHRYNQVVSNFQMTTQENRALKDQLGDIKQELLQSSSEKSNIIQKLRMELSMQKDKESNKIQNLEDQLAGKQQQIDKILRDNRNREKELQQAISNLKSKMNGLQLQHESLVRTQQRKVEKLERQLKTCNSAGNEAQLNAEALLKENVQLRQDNFRLTGQLNSKDLELKSHLDKFKMKWNSLKKDIKAKEKQCSDMRDSLRKYQRQANNNSSETESVRMEMRRLKETFESEKHSWESTFHKQKQSFQLMINQQACTLQQLESEKKYLLEQNKRLQMLLRKKETAEKQRRYLLKTEMKQIDKLQKVIDKIVE